MEEILHLLGCLFKTLVNNEIDYQPQLVKAGFLNHQQYLGVVSNIFYFHPYLGKIPILTNIIQRG